MKLPFLTTAALALLSVSVVAAPQLPIEQAVAIATKYLQSKSGGDKYYISAVVLEAESANRSKYHWSVTWSDAITINEQKKETGVEVAMDGSVVSLVKGPANRDPVTGEFNPNGSTGLGNPRTRSDRPSILDLKH